ncbi:MAG TPA: cation transporter dimerization domain-containing protein, partial [Tepidiformaceae bacterium]|nr:cation transporter dimerization domain-containing protein [Tepidiformaceae bacterium]
VVLTAVAIMLGVGARNMLLGAAAHPETLAAIRRVVGAFPEIETVVRLLTMQIGSNSVLVTGELRVARDMTTAEIEDVIHRLDEQLGDEVPEVSSTFWELHAGRRSS